MHFCGGDQKFMAINVIVMMGGPSTEHEVSLASGRMVYEALVANPHYQVSALVIDRQGHWTIEANPRRIQPQPSQPEAASISRQESVNGLQLIANTQVVFLAFHGAFGEDGTLQGLLETLGIPYTGSGPLASALAMNKSKAKELFRYHEIPVTPDVLLTRRLMASDIEGAINQVEERLAYPLVVKPNTGGSSVGVTMATNADHLREALMTAQASGLDVLVEEKLAGREVTCAVLEEFDGSLTALPVIEIVPRAASFFDFTSKYADGGSDEICPADLDPKDVDAIQRYAIKAHQVLGCEGFSRTDMFLTEKGPVVLEVNTIPGMTPNSLLPKAARAAGLSFEALMDHMVRLAWRRRS